MESVPPRVSGWVRSRHNRGGEKLRTHPLTRGGTDSMPTQYLIMQQPLS